MLAIRLQRTGRKGHAQFRMIVQDSRRTPTSGNIVAQLGHYDPHSKSVVIDKDKAAFYLEHGAQPTPRVVSILKSEKVSLPKWVAEAPKKSRAIRNLEKLRKNRPAEAEAPKTEAEPTETEAPAESTEKTEEAATPEQPEADTSTATEQENLTQETDSKEEATKE